MKHRMMGLLLVPAGLALFSPALTAGAARDGSAAHGTRSGAKIAFTRTILEPRYTSHLFVMNPDGSGLRQLTYGDVADRWQSWSPDGSRIVFERSVRSRGSDVFGVTADGTSLRRLTRTATSHQPAWSPDGRTIAYYDSTGVFVMNADGTGKRLLTDQAGAGSPARSPTWSPDARRIAFASSVGGIFVVNADGSGERRLTSGRSFACPAWSPDGRWIAFVSLPPLGYDSIYVVDEAGGPERRLTRHAYTESGFAWSPDSRRIVYAREKRGGVYTIDVDGTGDRRLTRNPLRQDFSADGFGYSPDRRRIAYASGRTGQGDIYLMNAGGGNQRQLTHGPDIDGAPAWSLSAYAGSC
jgi:Tol biopolymer transport system component